jgi:hypothetical protein
MTTDFEPEAEENTSQKKEGGSKYALLDRLFRFIDTTDKPLNPVLSGYFVKLVTLLINRRPK